MRLENNDIVSTFDAKIHLSQLLGQVQQGCRFMITKHNTLIRKHEIEGLSLQELQELKEEGRR